MPAAFQKALDKFKASIADMRPETIALIFALGLVLGVFPVFGLPTLLCAGAAILFRLNLPAIQIVNQVCAPLQYALLIPLGRLGARITRTPLNGNVLLHLADGMKNAIVGWGCFCVPMGLLLYAAVLFSLRWRRRACFNEAW
jgi:uncharacterized protein (DUF2062 family)